MKYLVCFPLLLCVLLLNSKLCLFAQISSSPAVPPVKLSFTVLNKDKKFVANLSKEDILIQEDGVPQEIISFEHQTDVPLSLSFLIDVSYSQACSIPTTRKVALSFVDSILRQDKDRAAIATFTEEVSVLQPLTANLQEVQSAIQRIKFVPPSGFPGGGKTSPRSKSKDQSLGQTAISDAVWFLCDQVFPQPVNTTKRVLILITDGIDTASRRKREEAINRAIKGDVVVYAIGIGDEEDAGVNKDYLKKVAEMTGGRSFFPDSAKDLQAAFSEIEQELRGQYVVTYSPTNKKLDSSYRKLRIELVNPEKKKDKLILIYRPGYYLQHS